MTKIKVSGVQKDIDKAFHKVNGVWKEIASISGKSAGVWRKTWESIINIYENGKEYIPFAKIGTEGTFEKRMDSLYLSIMTANIYNTAASIKTQSPINFDDITTLNVEWSATGNGNWYLTISKNPDSGYGDYMLRVSEGTAFSRKVSKIDVTVLKGEFYIQLHAVTGDRNQAAMSVFKVWGESGESDIQTLYSEGNQNAPFIYTGSPTFSDDGFWYNSDHMFAKDSGHTGGAAGGFPAVVMISTQNKMDLTNRKKVYADVKTTVGNTSDSFYFDLIVSNSTSGDRADKVKATTIYGQFERRIVELDVSDLTGSYYLKVGGYSWTDYPITISLYGMYLE
jgi:hypothetical protein